ncbi:MAG: hypothetical protein H5U01_09010 [Clostridia bacterium]|nr:hypothetical protein [Chloroflexota bacterium]MBC7336393.1 hypothetical protein [Clostridia bacterium]
METFAQRLVLVFFTALGVVLGAALAGSLAALFTFQPPVKTMTRLASEIKIWAIVAAIGGTFTMLEVLQGGLFEGEFRAVVKQLFYLAAALLGAQAGHGLIRLLTQP